jgi:hypothetical protein
MSHLIGNFEETFAVLIFKSVSKRFNKTREINKKNQLKIQNKLAIKQANFSRKYFINKFNQSNLSPAI